MHTTAPVAIDVPQMFAPVAAFARTTVRLHPRPGSPAVEQSSVGGPLLWPAHEPWPTCDGPQGGDHLDTWPDEAAAPLVPVLQLAAEDLPELPFAVGDRRPAGGARSIMTVVRAPAPSCGGADVPASALGATTCPRRTGSRTRGTSRTGA